MTLGSIKTPQVKVRTGPAPAAFAVDVVFTSSNWYQWQTIYVEPVIDDGLDGQDFKCFAVQPSLVQGIQGMQSPTHATRIAVVVASFF
jgi:hypothetical protein